MTLTDAPDILTIPDVADILRIEGEARLQGARRFCHRFQLGQRVGKEIRVHRDALIAVMRAKRK